jgi:hypothetical protein
MALEVKSDSVVQTITHADSSGAGATKIPSLKKAPKETQVIARTFSPLQISSSPLHLASTIS